jgi:hypothetical protein
MAWRQRGEEQPVLTVDSSLVIIGRGIATL